MGWILLLVFSIPLLYCLWTFLLTSLMGGEPEQMLSGRGITALARESLMQYWLWAMLPLYLLRPSGAAREEETGPIVILIPGFTESESIFIRLRKAMSRKGLSFQVYHFDTFRSEPFEEAGRLEKYLDRLSREFPGRDQVLVGHSLGALLAACCYPGPVGGRRRLLVAFGAPWKGTHLAHLALGPCGRSLRPTGGFVKSLTMPSGPEVLNIRSAHDTITVPYRAATLVDCPEVVVDGGWGHNSLLWCDEAVNQAVEWIRANG